MLWKNFAAKIPTNDISSSPVGTIRTDSVRRYVSIEAKQEDSPRQQDPPFKLTKLRDGETRDAVKDFQKALQEVEEKRTKADCVQTWNSTIYLTAVQADVLRSYCRPGS